MTKQLCFPGLKPSPPTIRTERVARRIAERIVAEVNLDEFYWEASELAERVEDVTREIVRCGRPATVFTRLHRQRNALGHHYGWEGIDEHCRAIGDGIAEEALERALKEYARDYGDAPA